MDREKHLAIGKGSLFIASPEILDGVYFRSVVLICEHTPSGSFGIIINKPMDVELPPEILDVSSHMGNNIQLRFGGPVQTNQLMLLHNNHSKPHQTLELCPGVYLGGDVPFLQEMIADTTHPPVRLCFGYTGWNAGQLEREFMDGLWFIHPARAELIFDIPAERLWQTVLREMGGKYATLSMIPDNLSLN